MNSLVVVPYAYQTSSLVIASDVTLQTPLFREKRQILRGYLSVHVPLSSKLKPVFSRFDSLQRGELTQNTVKGICNIRSQSPPASVSRFPPSDPSAEATRLVRNSDLLPGRSPIRKVHTRPRQSTQDLRTEGLQELDRHSGDLSPSQPRVLPGKSEYESRKQPHYRQIQEEKWHRSVAITVQVMGCGERAIRASI